MKIQEIHDLIKLVSKTGITEVEIEQKEFKITVKSEGKTKASKGGEGETTIIQSHMPMGMPQMQMPMQLPSAAPAASPPPKAAEAVEESSKYVTIKSPMIGTFYRSSGPDKPPYLNVGDSIKPGNVICIVEAMKLFNEIEAEISGTIIKVLADDASPVEYDQPLFLVDPS
jgi:acetyl-CoA carboxylase biotin carboxyl carrier protein